MSSDSSDHTQAMDLSRMPVELAVKSVCGYLSPNYASALDMIGRAEPFGATGGHVLVRRISGSNRHDLASPYPLFACTDWEALDEALNKPPGDPVSMTIVTDPFCPLPASRLTQQFDLCRPFHDHFLIDLAAPLAPSRHHRRMIKKAGLHRIEIDPASPSLVPRFVGLYANLVARKGITDLRAFPAETLAAQMAVPGAWLVSAWEGETLLGGDLYYHEGEIVRAHLSAYAPEGYACGVSYPMMAAAVDHFRLTAGYIDLGGVPASESDTTGGGIGHFKTGWTRISRPSYLCGKIYDADAYQALSASIKTSWFPAYRNGEYD